MDASRALSDELIRLQAKHAEDLERLNSKHAEDLERLNSKYLEDVNRTIQTFKEKQEKPSVVRKLDFRKPSFKKSSFVVNNDDDDDLILNDEDDFIVQKDHSIVEEDDFIVDDDDEDRINSCYESEEEERIVEKEEPKTAKRKRRVPQRYGKQVEKEENDNEEGDDCCESSSVSSAINREEDQWIMVRNKSVHYRNRNPWFRDHFYGPIRPIREGLGRQGNNTIAITVWDSISEDPQNWVFDNVGKFYGVCSLCGYKKPIYHKGYDSGNGQMYYFSSCCGPLAHAWHEFSIMLDSGTSTLNEMTQARDKVVECNSKKRSG